MTDGIDDGGPVFPYLAAGGESWTDEDAPGMSLRDYFAGQVVSRLYEARCRAPNLNRGQVARDAAEAAYELADVMLRLRQL